MPRIKNHIREGAAAKHAAEARVEREARSDAHKRLRAEGKAVAEIVLKERDKPNGETALVVAEMAGREGGGLTLHVGTMRPDRRGWISPPRVLGSRAAAAELRKTHEGEARCTGVMVVLGKPKIDRANHPLAAEIVDVSWPFKKGLGVLAVEAVRRVEGRTLSQLRANERVKAALIAAGRPDILEALKVKSGRKS